MVPVILSGGIGTRLWPLSRSTYPKQFCDLLDESLLEKTLKRGKNFGSPWVLTVKELSSLTQKVFAEMSLPTDQILLEPVSRNTAAAIGLICRVLELGGRASEIVGVFPADHLITNPKKFNEIIAFSEKCASREQVVTLGVSPSYAATGFGYIELSSEEFQKSGEYRAVIVKGFKEKPDFATAEKFIAAGHFVWNAGIFVFRASVMLSLLAKLLPEIYVGLKSLKSDLSNLSDVYAGLPSISIDVGILEKMTSGLLCLPGEFGWSDLGSWDDISRLNESELSGQLLNRAHVVKTNSHNNFVFSSYGKAVGLVDVDNLVIVDTPDALMIAKRDHTQNVRHIVSELSRQGHSAAHEHLFERRPWGMYTVLKEEEHYKSKLIAVDPGAQISYQYHRKRNEHWVIVRGIGEVTLDGEIRVVKQGDSVFIEAETKHRIRNIGKLPLEFIEVQTGNYFGEDDIIRLQDDYRRN